MTLSKDYLKHVIFYFFVGGFATIVEWVAYYCFDIFLNFNTYLSVALAFALSTFANWGAGRLTVFKNAPKHNLFKELMMIYAVSVIGLCLNEMIMFVTLNYVLVARTPLEKMVSKIVATGMVFFWNLLIRDLVIYKDKK